MEKPFRFDYNTGVLQCIKCKNKYSSYNDVFLTIINAESSTEITYELCLDCFNSCKNCTACKREYTEPWENVYLNLQKNTHVGKCCYNKNN